MYWGNSHSRFLNARWQCTGGLLFHLFLCIGWKSFSFFSHNTRKRKPVDGVSYYTSILSGNAEAWHEHKNQLDFKIYILHVELFETWRRDKQKRNPCHTNENIMMASKWMILEKLVKTILCTKHNKAREKVPKFQLVFIREIELATPSISRLDESEGVTEYFTEYGDALLVWRKGGGR